VHKRDNVRSIMRFCVHFQEPLFHQAVTYVRCNGLLRKLYNTVGLENRWNVSDGRSNSPPSLNRVLQINSRIYFSRYVYGINVYS